MDGKPWHTGTSADWVNYRTIHNGDQVTVKPEDFIPLSQDNEYDTSGPGLFLATTGAIGTAAVGVGTVIMVAALNLVDTASETFLV